MAQTQTPATRYQDEGDALDYTPAGAVYAGDIVLIGTVPAVVIDDIAAATKGSVTVEGVFKVPKVTGELTAGDAIYWDVDGTPVTGTALTGACGGTASIGNLMGFAVLDAGSSDSYAYVKLTSSKRTATIAGSVTADDITGSDASLGINGAPPATTSSAGGAVPIAGGIGGSVSGAGGAVSLTGGAGTAASSVGGASSVTGGAGGAAGVGGAASILGGSPASGNAAGGTLTASGGAGSGTGAGGAVTTKGGASGSGATGNGGAWAGGGGAAASTAGNGGAATLTGGVATGTGTGGAVTITSGASAGASGTAGAVAIDTGAAAGGTGAAITIGATNATSTKIGTAGAESAAIKSIVDSGTIAVTVPSITDPDCAKVDVSISALTFAAAVGDAVIAIPLEALPTNCRLGGAWVSATDQVTITFSSEGGNVTGAAKNFKFLIIDLT
jgi:predicted RecA/RadA family phage recombinase